jgi:hypothetical protein
MRKEFDFNEIGKKTPYRVPDSFFEEMQRKVVEEARKQSSRKRRMKVAMFTVLAAAAVAVGVIFLPARREEGQPVQLAKREFKAAIAQRPADSSAQAASSPVRQVAKADLQPSPKPRNAASAKKTESPADDSEWIEQLSDDDLRSLTALADNDDFLN